MKSEAEKLSTDYKGALIEFEQKFVHPMEGRTLIVGSQVYGAKNDRRKKYPDVLGVDMLDGLGVDRVVNLEEPLPEDLGQFAHVECMSVLEHSKRPWLMAANLERLMVPDATIFVTIPWVWRNHGYPDDYWRMTSSALEVIFPNIAWATFRLAVEGRLRRKMLNPSVRYHDGRIALFRSELCAFGRKIEREDTHNGQGCQR